MRTFIDNSQNAGNLIEIERQVDTNFELANVANALGAQLVLFKQIENYPEWQIVSGVCANRQFFCESLGVSADRLLEQLTTALTEHKKPPVMTKGACQEIVREKVNLFDLPILLHLAQDAGNYIASNVVITKDPEYGRNMCFHRLLRLDEKRFTARIIENRGTYNAMQKVDGDLPIAICIGVSHAVLLAASMSPPAGVDELSIAHALAPTPLVKCITSDLEVPASAEIVLEGRLTPQTTSEGPFMDLTETMDITRQQPIIEIDLITHRRHPIFHALLPGGLEHKILMGMPREPTILAEVNKVVSCLDVSITPGGSSWLHAVVKIDKQHDDDGYKAIQAAFSGHKSLKHVWIVDPDIDIHNPLDVEWAVATRFQADHDLYIMKNMPGSSLDPSGIHLPGQKSRTAKMGLDCTMPLNANPTKYRRGSYGTINLQDYLK